MCTITLIPFENNCADFVLTVNRDESVNREAIAPKIYTEKNTRLVYPKDKKSGGTWIGASDQKRLVCLMNGAYSQHRRKKSYRKSRGLVVKDMLRVEHIERAVENYYFDGIEQFTMLIFNWQNSLEIYEVIWDGMKIHFNKLPNRPQIWSAPMTYSEEVRKQREDWFGIFLKRLDYSELRAERLWSFHHAAKVDNKMNGLIIDRGELKTTSITQFIHRSTENEIRFKNLLTQEETLQKF